MQTITWSPQLNLAVRNLKKLNLFNSASNLINGKILETYQLSPSEEQAVKSTLFEKKATETVQLWWK
ncbi:hypothetical protein EHS13_22205 [Paenibacillus psychroresistens]|uniref:Uncharacterized protein n=1 Tax=Paenibacillus psychroresistens TaxID=1778678 RepID=A0A6B8RPH5_9BACL|nr:hypothetical protein [Paenibacillus psychroresistens]QGQ97403.1 hypothetical protein EHS13_22205 [Paenibacillus psychroresistens]